MPPPEERDNKNKADELHLDLIDVLKAPPNDALQSILEFLRKIIVNVGNADNERKDLKNVLYGSSGMDNGLLYQFKMVKEELERIKEEQTKAKNFRYILITVLVVSEVIISFALRYFL